MQVKLKAEPIHFLEVLSFPLTLLLFSPTYSSLSLGIILSLIGLGIKLWLFAYPKKRNRKFEVYGPYRFVRHPYFFSTLVLICSAAISGRSIEIFIFSVLVFSALFTQKSGKFDENRKRFFGIDYTYYKNCISSLVPSLVPYPSASQKDMAIKNVFDVRYKAEIDSFLIVGLFYIYGFSYLEFHQVRSVAMPVSAVLLLLSVFRLLRLVNITWNMKKRVT